MNTPSIATNSLRLTTSLPISSDKPHEEDVYVYIVTLLGLGLRVSDYSRPNSPELSPVGQASSTSGIMQLLPIQPCFFCSQEIPVFSFLPFFSNTCPSMERNKTLSRSPVSSSHDSFSSMAIYFCSICDKPFNNGRGSSGVVFLLR